MKKLTFIFVALLSMTTNVWSKTNIVVSTDNTQLILQVKENGRLYQTYLGERLADGTDLDLSIIRQQNIPR